jgi:hypothetical protein
MLQEVKSDREILLVLVLPNETQIIEK